MSQCLIYFIINKTFVSEILACKTVVDKTPIKNNQF